MHHPLKIAYLFQNTGIQFSQSFAVQLHISHQIFSLQQADHSANLVALQGRQVLVTPNIAAVRNGVQTRQDFGKLGLTNTRSYKFLESGVRRLQTELHLPYFALFDSHRMYEACCINLTNCDLIHERYNLLSMGGAVASKKLGIPYVLEVNADMLEEKKAHGSPEQGVRRRYAIWSTRYCFDTARKIISVSNQLKEHLVTKWNVPSEKIVVLPNAADTEAFGQHYDTSPIKRRLGLTNEPVVMFVGGFYPFHNLPLLIDSFARVVQKIPKAKLVLVGDGRTRSEVEQKIKENELDRSVIMIGAVKHEQVPTMLAIADVAVAPNIQFYEGHGGSPLKIFEYMAAGKAIVATRTGQVTEIIQDGNNGLLVEPGNVTGFAEAIELLLRNPAKRENMGRTARQQAVTQHSWDQYVQQLIDIYSETLSQR